MRRTRLRIALALVLGAGAVLATMPAQGLELKPLLERLAQTKQGHARFVETKYLAVLDQPVRSSGTLSYQAPGRIEKITLEPKPESLVLDGDVLRVQRNGKSLAVDLKSHRPVLAFVEAIRGVLMGDAALLEQQYEVSLAGTDAAWSLVLVPRDHELAAALARIRIDGGGAVVRMIEYVQRDGDRSVMQIEPDTGPAPE
jgi:outer membrane lipoprotein-sorting protein